MPARVGAPAAPAQSAGAPARANAPGKFGRRDLVIGSKDSLAAVVCPSFVLIFPGCRCDENDTLTINSPCGGVISGTVAMGAQAIRRYCSHTVNAVSACCRARAPHGKQPPRRAANGESAHPVVEAPEAWMDSTQSLVLCSLE